MPPTCQPDGILTSASLFGAGAGLGGPLGGLLNDTIGWRSAFLLQLPLLVISSLLVAIHVNIPLPQRPLTLRQKLARIDWLGSITLVFAVGCLLLGLTLKSTEELEWSDNRVWGLLAGSVVSWIAFVVAEIWISPEPVMPMRILGSRTPLAVAITNL
jgi:MFS family permease